jgi:hypothetical protein
MHMESPETGTASQISNTKVIRYVDRLGRLEEVGQVNEAHRANDHLEDLRWE